MKESMKKIKERIMEQILIYNYTDYIQKRNNSIIGRDNNNESARIGKKIKYLVKEKYSYQYLYYIKRFFFFPLLK